MHCRCDVDFLRGHMPLLSHFRWQSDVRSIDAWSIRSARVSRGHSGQIKWFAPQCDQIKIQYIPRLIKGARWRSRCCIYLFMHDIGQRRLIKNRQAEFVLLELRAIAVNILKLYPLFMTTKI
jgi:hypothetical protein